MSLGSTLRRLADVIDTMESAGVTVETVEQRTDGEEVVADIRLRVGGSEPAETGSERTAIVEPNEGGAASTGDRTSTRDGTQADASNGPASGGGGDGTATGGDDGTTAEEADGATATGDDDETSAEGNGEKTGETDDGTVGRVACRHEDCEETFETEHGMKIHFTKVHVTDGEAATPPHRDPERLREVYESCDSFAEMRDALGADVSAQTVRRHVIRHGIHEPETNGSEGNEPGTDEAEPEPEDDAGTGSDSDVDAGGDGRGADEPDGSGDEPEVNGDGPDDAGDERVGSDPAPVDAELPGDVTIRRVRRAVERADTRYEVQQALDLDRETTREVLADLDLLELVHGRVATKRDRDDRKDEIDERIRNSPAASSD